MNSNKVIKGKWNELYETEQDLIDDMMKAKSDVNKYRLTELVVGYEYVESFKRYYKKNGKLTDKQMTQLKRLASSIYKNIHQNNGLGSYAEI